MKKPASIAMGMSTMSIMGTRSTNMGSTITTTKRGR